MNLKSDFFFYFLDVKSLNSQTFFWEYNLILPKPNKTIYSFTIIHTMHFQMKDKAM